MKKKQFLLPSFSETYGKKSEEQDSFGKSEKRAEPKLVLIVNPEFTQHGILEGQEIQASSCVGPGKSSLPFELRGRARDCA